MVIPGTMSLRLLLKELVDFLNSVSYLESGLTAQVLRDNQLRVDLEVALSDVDKD